MYGSTSFGVAPARHLGRVKYGVFVVMIFSFAFVHQSRFNNATPVSRLDLLHALLLDGTMQIDRYDNTPDKAEFGGHYYSDKAPGVVALALPSFATATVVLSLAGVPLDSDQGWLLTSWITCVASIGTVTALGAGLLVAWLCMYVAPRTALVSALGIFLGAAPLPYATMMFSHSLVVGLLAIAMWSIAQGQWPNLKNEHDVNMRQPLRTKRYDLVSGAVCGLALASEFTSGIVVGGIFLWLVSHGWRRLFPFCLAAAPPLLLIPLYSWLCFGKPLTLPYSLNPSFPEMREGLYAIQWPDPEIACNLLFSPARGLLFWSPFLVMAGIGYWWLARTNMRLFWLTYGVPLLHIIVISGRIWDWPAGPTLGPRYLAPILPLLALPCALGVQRFPKTGLVLVAYSIGITTLATLTNACPPFGGHSNPLLDLHIPMFLRGEFSPNLGMMLGLSPFLSAALFYTVLVGGICWLWRQLPAKTTPHTVAAKLTILPGPKC